KGIGLYRIRKRKSLFIVETPNEKQSYSSLASFWEKIEESFIQEEYLLQKAIQADTFKGKRYDLRLLCHYDERGYIISGIGVRVACEDRLTTHVPTGRAIIPYESVSKLFNEAILQTLVFEIRKELTEQIAQCIGEISIDLGRAVDGETYIYEINPKPMLF